MALFSIGSACSGSTRVYEFILVMAPGSGGRQLLKVEAKVGTDSIKTNRVDESNDLDSANAAPNVSLRAEVEVRQRRPVALPFKPTGVVSHGSGTRLIVTGSEGERSLAAGIEVGSDSELRSPGSWLSHQTDDTCLSANQPIAVWQCLRSSWTACYHRRPASTGTPAPGRWW